MTLEYLIECHDYNYIKSQSISRVHMETFFDLLKTPKSSFHKFFIKNLQYLNKNFHQNHQYYLKVLEFYLMPVFFKELSISLKKQIKRLNTRTNTARGEFSLLKNQLVPIMAMSGGSNNAFNSMMDTEFDIGVQMFFLFSALVYLYNRNLDNLFNLEPPKTNKRTRKAYRNNRNNRKRKTLKSNNTDEPKLTILIDRYGRIDDHTSPRRALFIYGNEQREYFIKIGPLKPYDISGEIPYNNISKETIKDSYDSIDMGNYLYEGRIYESFNEQVAKNARNSMKDKVIQMQDYNLIDNPFKNNRATQEAKSQSNLDLLLLKIKEVPSFNVRIAGEMVDLNKIKIGNYDITDIWGTLMKYFAGDKKFVYLITECNPDFKTLKYREDNNQYSKDDFKKVFKNGIKLLKYMYKKFNYKHLDYHSGNILTSVSGDVKLFDFDFSEIRHQTGNKFVSNLISGYPSLNMELIKKAIYDTGTLTEELNVDLLSHCYDIYRFIFDSSMKKKITDTEINEIFDSKIDPIARKSKLLIPRVLESETDEYEFEIKIFYSYILFYYM